MNMPLTENENWTRACDVEDIPRLGSRVLERAAGNIAVFRNAQDQVFALLDRCPHKAGALSQGIVHGNTVTCPLHAWNIALDTGHACAPDEGCTQHFPIKVEGGEVFISLD
ncbi:nitrite reductase small subunit NirD [Paraburkholderia sacchari]|uniref:nitrite reductase small subunit NirD n=1 Tax=Paraburkholderia sacchari TaxID=159450 RepID=UPI001FD3A5E2|nr:nitrite reductase small subunit NirD [Paraburkholderia sacchari]